MSRSQSTSVYNTATDENKQDNANAQASYGKAQDAVSDYSNALAKYAGANPYGAGGAYQTAQNTAIANTADGMAASGGAALQEQAARTGENRTGAQATTEELTQQGERDLASQQATANADRIGKGAQYGQTVLEGSTVPITAESQLASQQGQLASGNLNTAAGSAAANKSFLDQFGGAFTTGLGDVLSTGSYGKHSI